MPDPGRVTVLLRDIRGGSQEAKEELLGIVYQELRRRAQDYMRHERAGHTLQATALVHEAYIRIFGSKADVDWRDRAHFFAVAAKQMRQVLRDHGRSFRAAKRGSGPIKIELNEAHGFSEPRAEDLIAVEELLTQLEQMDPRAGKVVELRFFAGMTEQEASEVLSVPLITVKRDWEFAKAWLMARLTSSSRPH